MKNIAGSKVNAVLALAAIAGLMMATVVGGAEYPTKPIRLIVGYQAGGNTDTQARLLAPELHKILGVPVIVDNRPGASGVPAAEMVMHAAPDGHTLLWATSASHAVPVVAMPRLSYNPVKDFTLITLISINSNVIVGSTSLAADSLDSLLTYLKANPGTPIGTPGPTTSGRFAVELMKPKLGINLTIVPYKATGQLLTDLAGNHIQLGIMGASEAVSFIKSKKIRAYAVTSVKRSTVLPDVPTFNETVSPGFEAVAWNALLAPPGMPAAIVERWRMAMRKAAEVPVVKQRLSAVGLNVVISTPAELERFMKDDIAKWVQVAKENKLTFE
ncbi:MAG: tripartite tricarboxylate transporter substrate binding protein [Pseudomonadota bacterium]